MRASDGHCARNQQDKSNSGLLCGKELCDLIGFLQIQFDLFISSRLVRPSFFFSSLNKIDPLISYPWPSSRPPHPPC